MSNKDSTLWILIALLVVVVLLFSGGGMMGFGMGFGAIPEKEICQGRNNKRAVP